MRFEKWQALGNDYLIFERGGAPLGADRGADRAGSATRISGSAPTGSCCSRAARTRSTSPSCGSSTRTARRPSSPATAPARRSSTCAVTAGPTRTASRSCTAAGPITPTITGELTCSVEMGRASTDSKDFPTRRPGRQRGTWSPAGASGTSSTSRSATRSARSSSARSSRTSTCAAIGPEIEGDELFPNRTNVSFLADRRQHGCGRGSSSAAWGRRSPRGPGRAAPRSPPSCAARQSPIIVELDGGELEVEISEDLDVRLTGWAEPVYAGELSPELLAALGRRWTESPGEYE